MAENTGNLQLRIRVEQERRRRQQEQSQPAPEEQQPEELRPRTQRQIESVVRGVSRLADVPYDLAVRGPYELAQYAAGRRGEEIDILPQFSSYAPKSQGTPSERATEFATEGLIASSAIPVRTAQAPYQIYQMASKSRFPGVLKSIYENTVDTVRRLGRNIVQTKSADPGAFMAAEALASGGAGAATQYAEDMGGGPKTELVAGVFGSGVASTLLGLPRSLMALKQGFQSTILPMTTAGGEIRAARQMQARAGGPERAEILAERLKDMPEGMTPAQYLGDDLLLAQQARIFADDPELAQRVSNDLAESKILLQNALEEMAGQPSTPKDWEVSILESIVPQGVSIKRGSTQVMLNQAYNSFKPLYNEARGFPVNFTAAASELDIPTGIGGDGQPRPLSLSSSLTGAAFDESVLASDESRRTMYNWLNNLTTKYIDKVKNGTVDSGDIIDMRSDVRDKIRAQEGTTGNQEYADLLSGAEANLTALLEFSLPNKAKQILNGADLKYKKYKTYETAVYNAGDQQITPQNVSESIRRNMTSPSRYARGVDPETQKMRQLALTGQDFDRVFGNPLEAQRIVRDMTPEQKKIAKADFAQILINRSINKGTETLASGRVIPSGQTLIQDIYKNRTTLRALGYTPKEIQALTNMSRTLVQMQKKSPEAVAKLFEDGPSSLLELGATLIGAKQGQNLAGSGLGSSLVLASYMTNRARRILSSLTSDQATKIMSDAATDPKLYRALLVKSVNSPKVAKDMATYLETYLYQSGFEAGQEGEE